MKSDTIIKQLMTVNLRNIEADTPVSQIMTIFASNSFHHIPVVDEKGMILGIVTPQDLDRIPHFGREVSDLRAKHIMTASLFTVKESTSVREVADMFEEKHFRSLPVVNNDNKLVGLITTSDLLAHYRNNTNSAS